MSPQPHGLPHDFAFDKKQLEYYKTNQILADIRVDKWGDFDIVTIVASKEVTRSKSERSQKAKKVKK
jgi:hypothetical protein